MTDSIPPLAEGFISIHERLPVTGHRVYVQCAEFRLLGYRDSLGTWRGYYHNRELRNVIGWKVLGSDLGV